MKNKREFIIAIISLFVGVAITAFILQNCVNTKDSVPKALSVEVPKIPECVAFICPEYFGFPVAGINYLGDTSVVIVPTAMTQGAGKLMIIRRGKIIFESPVMPGIGVSEVGDGDGFILEYNGPSDENLNRARYEVRYRYRNGQFIPDSESNINEK